MCVRPGFAISSCGSWTHFDHWHSSPWAWTTGHGWTNPMSPGVVWCSLLKGKSSKLVYVFTSWSLWWQKCLASFWDALESYTLLSCPREHLLSKAQQTMWPMWLRRKGAHSVFDTDTPTFLEDQLLTVHTSVLLEIALSRRKLAPPKARLRLGRQPLSMTAWLAVWKALISFENNAKGLTIQAPSLATDRVSSRLSYKLWTS